ncbi:nuclease A inhibitor family protein [Telluribacter sp.]|jgi:hypothetical protein|uniref:nuclease A inhibitor family protein n=1 Tax=Telluribacter sp. TaxID=1978767 RepID=UPI002E12EA7F|nr:nuclease A inhibitor family protein [Telluribacter sp.]
MSLQATIEPLLVELYYPSESDEPVEFVSVETRVPTPLSPESFVSLFAISSGVEIKEAEPEKFWSAVTVYQDWYLEEEVQRTRQFVELKARLEKDLAHLQYFRVGEITIAAYVVGTSSEGRVEGIKTALVET